MHTVQRTNPVQILSVRPRTPKRQVTAKNKPLRKKSNLGKQFVLFHCFAFLVKLKYIKLSLTYLKISYLKQIFPFRFSNLLHSITWQHVSIKFCARKATMKNVQTTTRKGKSRLTL